MNNKKFQINTVGVGPVQSSDSLAFLGANESMAASSRHMRSHGSTGTTPALEMPVKILRDHAPLATSAFELANAHYAATAGGVDSPSREAIVEQTPILAQSIGLTSTIRQEPKNGFATRAKAKGPAMG